MGMGWGDRRRRAARGAASLAVALVLAGCGAGPDGTPDAEGPDGRGASAPTAQERGDAEGTTVPDAATSPGEPAEADGTTDVVLSSIEDTCFYEGLTRVQTEVLGADPPDSGRSDFTDLVDVVTCNAPSVVFDRNGNGIRAVLILQTGDLALTDPAWQGTVVSGQCAPRSEPVGAYTYTSFCEGHDVGLDSGSARTVVFSADTPDGPRQVALGVAVGSEGWPEGSFSADFPSEDLIVEALSTVIRDAATVADGADPEVVLEVEAGDEAVEVASLLVDEGLAERCLARHLEFVDGGAGTIVMSSTSCLVGGDARFTVVGIPREDDLAAALAGGRCLNAGFQGVLSIGRVYVHVQDVEIYDYVWSALDQAGFDVVEQC